MRCRLSILFLIPLTPTSKAVAQALDIQNNRFTADVRILTAIDYLPSDVLSTLVQTHAPLPGPVTVGTVEGITYLYRDNGRALFATTPAQTWQDLSSSNSWSIECNKDAMEDFVTCSLLREDLALALTDSGHLAIFVGRNLYPRSPIALRVDHDAPLATYSPGFEGAQADSIVRRMGTARSLTTRYQEWPYQANLDRTLDLYGFNQAFHFLRWVVTRFK